MLSSPCTQSLRVVRQIGHLLMCECLTAAESECALVCVCAHVCGCAGEPSAFECLPPVIMT